MTQFLDKRPFLLYASFSILFVLIHGTNLLAQDLQLQGIRGEVLDRDSGLPLIGATIDLLNTEPKYGTVTDAKGQFFLSDIPLGRYDVRVSYLGYKTYFQPAILVSSAEETLLFVEMEEERTRLNEVIISDRRQVSNEAALLSARSVGVEELSRIPGSLDDPSRAIRKFPGIVTNAYISDNSFSVRGNTPRSLMWRLEGVDIYNPNHFATMGESSGGITIFSQRLLSNSDFYSGAFPADYGNALGGVFDMRFRNGNFNKAQHSVQFSFLGVDLTTEGPIGKQGKSSYIFNYRFSSTKLLDRFLNLSAIPVFQDISFKLNHRTKDNANINMFALLGGSSSNSLAERDTTAWKDSTNGNLDRINIQRTGSVGLSYGKALNKTTYFKTAMVATALDAEYLRALLNDDLISADTTMKGEELDYRLTWTTYLNKQFSKRHSHRSGLIVNYMATDVDYSRGDIDTLGTGSLLSDTIRYAKGDSYLLQAYSRSQFYLNENLQLNVGVHGMFHLLNNDLSIEPRIGLRYSFRSSQSISLGYGLHSQMEPLFIYLSESYDPQSGTFRRYNDNLSFSKAHHFNISYLNQLSDRWRLGVEFYYQSMFDYVVGAELPVSRIGAYDLYYAGFDLDNGGVAENYGVEFFAERNFKDGYSLMFNTSVFESNYTANDGIKRSSAFNAGLIMNVILGKEWKLNAKSRLSVTTSYTYTGPMYHTTIDVAATELSGYYTQMYTDPNTLQTDALNLVDVSLILNRNKKRFNSTLKLQISNALNRRAFMAYNYNFESRGLEEVYGSGLVPLLSWRIGF